MKVNNFVQKLNRTILILRFLGLLFLFVSFVTFLWYTEAELRLIGDLKSKLESKTINDSSLRFNIKEKVVDKAPCPSPDTIYLSSTNDNVVLSPKIIYKIDTVKLKEVIDSIYLQFQNKNESKATILKAQIDSIKIELDKCVLIKKQKNDTIFSFQKQIDSLKAKSDSLSLRKNYTSKKIFWKLYWLRNYNEKKDSTYQKILNEKLADKKNAKIKRPKKTFY